MVISSRPEWTIELRAGHRAGVWLHRQASGFNPVVYYMLVQKTERES